MRKSVKVRGPAMEEAETAKDQARNEKKSRSKFAGKIKAKESKNITQR